MPTGIVGRGSSRGQHLEIDAARDLQNGNGEVLNACVDCHPFVKLRNEGNLIFQVSLELGPISAPEIRAIRWVMKG